MRRAIPGRRIILGGIPIAVTLASKPALAMTRQCSVSNALSGNLSHPLPNGVNCGLTPATWESLAGTNQLWQRTGFFPSTNFTSAAGGPGFGSGWIVGSQSLLSALQGGLSVQIKIKGNQTSLNATAFGEQVAAALLMRRLSRRTISRTRCRKCSSWSATSGSRHRTIRARRKARSAISPASSRRSTSTPEPPPMTDAATRAIGSFVHWREWDGEIIAYNDRTGDTHHFADFSAWLLRRLTHAPASDMAIAAAVTARNWIAAGDRSRRRHRAHARSLHTARSPRSK